MAEQTPDQLRVFPAQDRGGKDKLLNETTPALNALGPEFFSVTYGAGGSTRDTTLGVVSAIRDQGIDVAPHLSFGGDDENAVGELLEDYRERASTAWWRCAAIFPRARAARRNWSTPTSWWSLFASTPATTSRSRSRPTRRFTRRQRATTVISLPQGET